MKTSLVWCLAAALTSLAGCVRDTTLAARDDAGGRDAAAPDAGDAEPAPLDAPQDALDVTAVMDTVSFDAGPCTECLPDEISWQYGGFDAGFTLQQRVSGCRVYTATATYFGTSGTVLHCATPLRGCGEGFGLADLERALAHPDVSAAFAEVNPYYGAVVADGAVLMVYRGEHVISIASPCTPEVTNCLRPIPPGLTALRDVLARIQTDATLQCRDAGPSTDLGADTSSP